MNTFRYIIASLAFFFGLQFFAQADNMESGMNFKLKQMDNMTWGVFAVPGESINPTKKSNTGSGQVTIVTPIGFTYAGMENFGGTWIENARVDGPMEAPDNAYISFGFVADEPRIKYAAGKETLLFTFVAELENADISLFDNENDPFSEPNTYGTNPGNDLGIVDFDQNGSMLVFNYTGNLETENVEPKAVYANKKSAENKANSSEYKAVFVSEKLEAPKKQ